MSSDVWLEPELWADYGRLDEVEKNESHVLKNDLFTISPKKGCLEPGSFVSITITYRYGNFVTSDRCKQRVWYTLWLLPLKKIAVLK